MEFFIKKNATLPILKLQVVKDGRSDYNWHPTQTTCTKIEQDQPS